MKKEAMLYGQLENKKVHCYLCPHECHITESNFGFCGIRKNIDGKLYSMVYNEPITANADPIEKKPLYHFLPGSNSFSIATIGCNFKCEFCQNWRISQSDKKDGKSYGNYELTPEDIVGRAEKQNCQSIAYTYTEPTIFFEYAYDISKIAKEKNISNVFVTNGYMSTKAIEKIHPYLDAANVDLKFFKDKTYRNICKGRLKPVLDSIRLMREKGIWLEITTLVVPGQNDSEEELSDIASFISEVGNEIPWHLSRYHPNYKYDKSPATPIETLKKAKDIGKKAGLKYIYLGNIGVEGTDTYCYNCGSILVKRSILGTSRNNIKNGKCYNCGKEIDGVWKSSS